MIVTITVLAVSLENLSWFSKFFYST